MRRHALERKRSLNLTYVKRVCQEIGAALEQKRERHTVVIRSTMLPVRLKSRRPHARSLSGRRRDVISASRSTRNFCARARPLKDLLRAALHLVGRTTRTWPRACAASTRVDAPVQITSTKAAEMVKYACNCFHALKVSFCHEIGNICKGSALTVIR